MKVCLRRWYVMLPVLLLAAGVGTGMARQLKPAFTAVGNYAFVYKHANAITDKSDPRDSNPLATNNAALLGEAVQNDLLSISTQARLGGTNSGVAPGQASDGSHYSITLPQASSSYLVQTWGSSAQEVRSVLNAVLAQTKTQATQIQDGVGAPPNSQYSAFVTAPTQVVELPKKSPAKVLIGVFGVGLLAGAAMSLLVDRILTRRAARRASGRSTGNAGGPAAGDDAPPDASSREEPTPRDDPRIDDVTPEKSIPEKARPVPQSTGGARARTDAARTETDNPAPEFVEDELQMGQALRS